MAFYTITDAPIDDWEERDRRYVFKYRYRSADGSPVAQDEFDRRRNAGQSTVLMKWDYGAKIMEQC
jgi:hypothetical protein